MLPRRGPLPRNRHHDSTNDTDAAGRFRRDPGRGLGDPRVPDMRHARDILLGTVRARPLHQLPARETAGRPPRPPKIHEGRELRRFAKTPRASTSARRPILRGTTDEIAVQEEINHQERAPHHRGCLRSAVAHGSSTSAWRTEHRHGAGHALQQRLRGSRRGVSVDPPTHLTLTRL